MAASEQLPEDNELREKLELAQDTVGSLPNISNREHFRQPNHLPDLKTVVDTAYANQDKNRARAAERGRTAVRISRSYGL